MSRYQPQQNYADNYDAPTQSYGNSYAQGGTGYGGYSDEPQGGYGGEYNEPAKNSCELSVSFAGTIADHASLPLVTSSRSVSPRSTRPHITMSLTQTQCHLPIHTLPLALHEGTKRLKRSATSGCGSVSRFCS